MNNFKDYGFEADFEGEICFQDDDFNRFFGFIVEDGKKLARSWNKYGVSGMSYEYDLTPIKKPWYENIDCKKPAHFIDLETNTLGLAHGYNMNGDYCLNDFWKNSLSHISNARPATKEEVLTLLVKE